MQIKNQNHTHIQSVLCLITGFFLTLPAISFSQTGATVLEEITVTARKREENLQDIPLSITAFSAADIENAGFQGLEDLSLQATGVQFHNQGGQQPGRYNTQIRFRGMNTAQFSPSFATGALFVDGVYILNGGTTLALDDVERVEVIKGPQSAQFGRNTFGGAVNFITKTPSLDRVEGKAAGEVDHRGTYVVNGNVSVPLLENKAALSLSGRIYDKRGHYVATDGGRLGNEETWSLSGKFYAEPTDNLKLTIRGSYAEDDDGAAAAGFVSGVENDSCTGLSYTTDSGETATPSGYVCGAIPDIGSAATTSGQRIISTNTGVAFPSPPASTATFFLDRAAMNPLPPGVPDVTTNGLKRETKRFSARLDYQNDNGWGGSFLAGYNEQGANWVRDFDLSDQVGWLSRDPQYAEDWSVEGRIFTPQDNRWRASFGVNYYEQEFTSSGGGGDAATGCFTVVDLGGCITSLFFPNSYQNNDQSEVLGIFGSLEFDLTEKITLSFEGRWQDDTLMKGGAVGATGLGTDASSIKTDKFLPRGIIRFQPYEDTTLYASYSKGILQGDINTFLQNADAQELAQYNAQLPGASATTAPEELEAFELGWKQTFMDGRARIALAAYYQEWSNSKGRSSAQINETCDAGKFGQNGCNPADGIMLGDPAMIGDGMGGLTPFFNSRNILVTGDAELYGIELESSLALQDNWTTDFNVTWAANKYKDYLFNFITPIAGFSNMRGNTQPRFPEWSGNFSTTYTQPVSLFQNDMDGFARLDTIYFGSTYVDEANLAETEDYFLVNLRAGVDTGKIRAELYINNLFDEDAWSAGSRWTDFSVPTFFPTLVARQGIAVSPQNKRTFGVRISYSFDGE